MTSAWDWCTLHRGIGETVSWVSIVGLQTRVTHVLSWGLSTRLFFTPPHEGSVYSDDGHFRHFDGLDVAHPDPKDIEKDQGPY
jgi:hypothetical protein